MARRKHKRKRTKRYRHNPKRSGFAMNPRRRRYRRRAKAYRHSYRRNPPAMRGVLNDTLWAGVGYVGTKFAVGAVLPAINIAAAPPSMTSILAKGGVAYGVALLAEKVLGQGKFTPVFIGGVVSAIQDAVALYIAPSVPALAGPMGAYYRPPMVTSVPRRALPAGGMAAYNGNAELSAEDMI